MIDIHCHFLPGLDDGARSPDIASKMLAIARDAGTTDLVATPHADTKYRYDPVRVEELLAETRAYAPDGLHLHRGCDFHLMHDNIEDALRYPTRYTVNGGRYLLVELSDFAIFHNTGELFARLEQSGMTIILTHPERNPLLRQRFELIAEWVAAGRLMQVTASSLTGQWGAKALDFSRRLLDAGLVHFVASDGHDDRHRPPRLDLAREWLTRHYSAELAGLLLAAHPRAVIENRLIDLSQLSQCKRVAEQPGWLGRLFRRKRQDSGARENDTKS